MGPQVVGPLELVQKWSQKLPSTGMNRALILSEGIKIFYRVLPLLWLLKAWLGLPWAGLDGLWAVHDGLHHLILCHLVWMPKSRKVNLSLLYLLMCSLLSNLNLSTLKTNLISIQTRKLPFYPISLAQQAARFAISALLALYPMPR